MPDISPNKDLISFTAKVNLPPSVVVKIDTTIDNGVTLAVAADFPFGITQEWIEYAPGTPYDLGYAALAGHAILVYGPGSIARAAAKATAPALTPGSVGADANSKLVNVSSSSGTLHFCVGYLLESGTAATAEMLRVYVFPHTI